MLAAATHLELGVELALRLHVGHLGVTLSFRAAWGRKRSREKAARGQSNHLSRFRKAGAKRGDGEGQGHYKDARGSPGVLLWFYEVSVSLERGACVGLALALARSVDRRSMIVYDLLIIRGGRRSQGPARSETGGPKCEIFPHFSGNVPPPENLLLRLGDLAIRHIGISGFAPCQLCVVTGSPFDRARRHQGLRGGGSERVDPRPARGGTRAAGRNRSTSTAPSVFTRRRLSCRSLWVLGCFSRSNPRSREAMFHTGSALR